MHNGIKFAVVGSTLAGGLLIATAVPAFAGDTPVNSTVTIGQAVTVSGIQDVPFGNAIPGQTVKKPSAENIEVSMNYTSGSISITNQNGGFRQTPGSPDVIPDQAVTILTDNGTNANTLNESGTPVLLDRLSPGDHWSRRVHR